MTGYFAPLWVFDIAPYMPWFFTGCWLITVALGAFMLDENLK
jgi:hypothetical protein